MRTNLFLSAIITTAALVGVQMLAAQNTSPFWSTVGNSNATTQSKLGTTNSIPLRLFTSNKERVQISALGNVGIGTAAPAQKLHVAGNTYITGNVGIGTTNFKSKLVVNSTGTVSPFSAQVAGVNRLYVGANGGVSVGSGSMPPANGLYVTGSVGIGTAAPAQKLHVAGNTYITGNVGIGIASPSSKLEVHGGAATAVSGISSSTGVYGSGTTTGVYGSSNSRGVSGISTNGYGGYFYSTNGTGLWAGTGRSDQKYAAVLQGNVYAYGVYTSSDKNLKQNVAEFGDAISIINKLKPKHYEFRQDGKYATLNLPQGRHYGLMAQEVEEILPGLVKESSLPLMESPEAIEPAAEDGKISSESLALREQKEETMNIKAVNYTELIPILVKALQEQDQKIEQQQQQINELKQLVSKLTQGQTINTSLSSGALLQNIPNPVKGSTSITYSLPEGAGRAQLIVTDALGRIIKTLQVTQSGVVNFDVSTLSSGVYNYSLVVDNKTIQTRKMTVEK